MSTIAAIVGRPNVGKSTFFNRLTETRRAIVDEVSGVTRDRLYGKADWCGKEFSVIDTGGWSLDTNDFFAEEIRKQVIVAIEEAQIILFMVDVAEGITGLDQEVADLLRRCKKPVFVVANKVDNAERISYSGVFHSLGLGDVYCISAINGSGTGELLDEVVKYVEIEEEIDDSATPKISIIGRPNVGKSSLVNALIGEERNIVTSIAGTTRDSIDTKYNRFGFEFILVDTAGIRKKTKVHEDLEFYSVMRAISTIEASDVCFLVIDASLGLESQDINIFRLTEKNKKGVVILVNKWDLVEKETNTMKEFEATILRKIAPASDIPIIFISALTKQRIFKAVETAIHVFKNRSYKIPTSKLNDVMLPVIEKYPPPSVKGKYVKIKFITQLPTPTPTFAFFCNMPQYIREDYKRFLENKLREHFDFAGVPIVIYFRAK